MENKKLIETLKRYSQSLVSKMKMEQKSINTIKSYETTIRLFCAFLESYKPLTFKSIREQDIYNFFSHRSSLQGKGKELKSSSISVMISHIKKLFMFIERNSEELYDFTRVFEDIKMKKVSSSPRGLTKEEQIKVVDYLKMLTDKSTKKTAFVNNRNSFLIKLMLFAGLRISEALTISLKHLKQEENNYKSLEFIGKGNKDRFALIEQSVIASEVDYFINVYGYDMETPIAKTKKGTPLNRINFYSTVANIFKKAGVNKKGLHILRHTFAKNLVSQSKPVTVVQKLLGHASLQTTSVYTNPTKQIIIDTITKGD